MNGYILETTQKRRLEVSAARRQQQAEKRNRVFRSHGITKKLADSPWKASLNSKTKFINPNDFLIISRVEEPPPRQTTVKNNFRVTSTKVGFFMKPSKPPAPIERSAPVAVEPPPKVKKERRMVIPMPGIPNRPISSSSSNSIKSARETVIYEVFR